MAFSDYSVPQTLLKTRSNPLTFVTDAPLTTEYYDHRESRFSSCHRPATSTRPRTPLFFGEMIRSERERLASSVLLKQDLDVYDRLEPIRKCSKLLPLPPPPPQQSRDRRRRHWRRARTSDGRASSELHVHPAASARRQRRRQRSLLGTPGSTSTLPADLSKCEGSVWWSSQEQHPVTGRSVSLTRDELHSATSSRPCEFANAARAAASATENAGAVVPPQQLRDLRVAMLARHREQRRLKVQDERYGNKKLIELHRNEVKRRIETRHKALLRSWEENAAVKHALAEAYRQDQISAVNRLKAKTKEMAEYKAEVNELQAEAARMRLAASRAEAEAARKRKEAQRKEAVHRARQPPPPRAQMFVGVGLEQSSLGSLMFESEQSGSSANGSFDRMDDKSDQVTPIVFGGAVMARRPSVEPPFHITKAPESGVLGGGFSLKSSRTSQRPPIVRIENAPYPSVGDDPLNEA